jgi:hypothetical protein
VAGLEANAAKTKFFMYRHQTAGQDQNLAKSKYLGTTVTNQNYSEEQFKFTECMLPCISKCFFFPAAL